MAAQPISRTHARLDAEMNAHTLRTRIQESKRRNSANVACVTRTKYRGCKPGLTDSRDAQNRLIRMNYARARTSADLCKKVIERTTRESSLKEAYEDSDPYGEVDVSGIAQCAPYAAPYSVFGPAPHVPPPHRARSSLLK
jgi:hypothetical protein